MIIPILRRVLFLAGLLAAVTLALRVEAPLVRLKPADLAADYEKTYASPPPLGVMELGRELIRRETPPQPFAHFVAERTRDRTARVEGPAWRDLMAALEAGATPAERRGRGYADGTFFFAPDEAPLADVAPGLIAGRKSFVYLYLPDPAGPRFAALTVVKASDAASTAPDFLLYPWRKHAPWALLAAIVLYAALPWPRRIAADALRYRRATAVVGQDIAGGIATAFFFGMAFLVVAHNSSTGRLLDFDAEGWGFVVAPMWLVAAIFASVFAFTAWFEPFQIAIDPLGLRRVTLFDDRTFRFGDIRRVGFADYRPPKWLRTIMFIAGMINWRMMGQALLLQSRRDWGILIEEKDGRRTRVMFSHMPGHDRIIEALLTAKVKVDKAVLDRIAAENAVDEPAPPTPP